MEHSYEKSQADSVPPSNTHYKPAITIHPKVRAHIGFFDSLNMNVMAKVLIAPDRRNERADRRD